MQMMYEIIAESLESSNNHEHSHPCDYLNFYCLGNREELPEEKSDHKADQTPNGNTTVSRTCEI